MRIGGNTPHKGIEGGIVMGSSLVGGSKMGGAHYGGGGSGGGPGAWKYRKLDMPLFDGEDPDGWIMRVEKYFDFYKLT